MARSCRGTGRGDRRSFLGVARLRAGVPLRHASHCLCYLAGAECASAPGTTPWRTPSWPSRSPRTPTGSRPRLRAHVAAVVPALRGDWSGQRPRPPGDRSRPASGDPETITAGAIAQAFLAMARGDLQGVTDAAAAVRATGKAEVRPAGPYDWRTPRSTPYRPGPFRSRRKLPSPTPGGPVTGSARFRTW